MLGRFQGLQCAQEGAYIPPRLASVDSYSITDLSVTDRSDSYGMESVRSRGDGGMTAQSEGGRGLAECGVAIVFLIIVTL